MSGNAVPPPLSLPAAPGLQARAIQDSSGWKILNSPFFLFLCSSVVIAMVSSYYSRHQANISAVEARRVQLSKFIVEFQYRVTRLERDEYDLVSLDDGDEKKLKAIGDDITGVIQGSAPHATSDPAFRDIYLGVIADQLDLTAGLPGNHELAPDIEMLAVDPCEAARDLHSELNIFREWARVRSDQIDTGFLPKLPREILPQAVQDKLVLPAKEKLSKGANDDPAFGRSATILAALAQNCE